LKENLLKSASAVEKIAKSAKDLKLAENVELNSSKTEFALKTAEKEITWTLTPTPAKHAKLNAKLVLKMLAQLVNQDFS